MFFHDLNLQHPIEVARWWTLSFPYGSLEGISGRPTILTTNGTGCKQYYQESHGERHGKLLLIMYGKQEC